MNPTKAQLIDALKGAQQAFVQQDYATALMKYQWVEKHIQDDPENLPPLWIEIGWTYYLMQNYANAISFFNKALKSEGLSEKQVFDSLRLIGFAHSGAGNFEKAIAYLQDALRRDVPEAEKRFVYFELGKIFFSQHSVREAKPYLEKAMVLMTGADQEYVQTTIYYLGFIAFFERDLPEAQRLFEAFIANAPTESAQAPGHFGLAHLHFHEKDYAALLELSQKIMALDPDFFDKETIAFFLCKSYQELGMLTELALFFKELRENYPEGRYARVYPEFQAALNEKMNGR